MITRKNYRTALPAGTDWEVCRRSLKEDERTVRDLIKKGKCLTAALYRFEKERPDSWPGGMPEDGNGDMLFLYLEALDETLAPGELFPGLSENLTQWIFMEPVFWHAVPENPEDWARQGKKVRRGRIARLLPDKRDSYLKYHREIVEEGLLEGDRYQFIANHEDILFSYFEEPKIPTHIRKDVREKSRVIEQWLAADPESHFDHSLSGKENFLLIEEVFSLGAEIV